MLVYVLANSLTFVIILLGHRSCSQPVEYSGKMKRLMAATDYAGPEVVGGTKWSELSVGIIMIDWNCISCSRLST
jgi:hypothetical protein